MVQDLTSLSKSEQVLQMVKKKMALSLCYLLFALVQEALIFVWIAQGLPEYFLLDLGIILLFALCTFVMPGFIFQTVVICALLFVQGLLSVVNSTLYSISTSVFSFSMLSVAGEAGNVFSIRLLDIWFLVITLVLYGIAVFSLVLINRKVTAQVGFVLHSVPMILFFYLLSGLISFGMYDVSLKNFKTLDTEDPFYVFFDDYYLWQTQFLPMSAFKKFGSFGFYCVNFANFISSKQEEYSEETILKNVDILDDYFADGEWNSSLQPYGEYGDILTGRAQGKNVVLLVMETGEWSGINPEYTPTLYALASQGIAMTNYYARDKTNHSEALSILGSYPVETNNSILPSFNNKDGLLQNNFAFSSANVLGSKGYTTNYFHANDGEFYSRELTHHDLYGFDNVNFLDTMDRMEGYYEKNGFYDFDRDSEMISQYLSAFTRVDEGDSNFFTMMLSLISHGHYLDLYNNGDYTSDLSAEEKQKLSEKYEVKNLEVYFEKIDDFPQTYFDDKFAIQADRYDENGEPSYRYLEYKRHQAGMMDLDVGLNRLIHELDESGELENTVFVCYADHGCYYDDMYYDFKGVTQGEYWNTHLYNIPFFIWFGDMDLDVENIYEGVSYQNNCAQVDSVYDGEFYYELHLDGTSEIPAGRIEKVCNSFDILPTILDLLGIDFNQNLYQGISVLREGTHVFVSRESGIFTEGIYFDGEVLYMDAELLPSGECRSFDGQLTLYPDGSIGVLQEGTQKIYSAEVVQDSVTQDEEGDMLFIVASEIEKMLPDSVVSFLLNVNEYYAKQKNLENMYRYDYFAYADIGQLIH